MDKLTAKKPSPHHFWHGEGFLLFIDLLFFFRFRSKQNSQRVGSTMAGNSAAGLGHINIVKMQLAVHHLPHLLHISGVNAGMGDEDPVGADVGILVELFLGILGQHRVQAAPVLFSHPHAAAGVVHLNAGLELQKIGAKSRHRRAAPAGVEKFQGVQNKAGVVFLGGAGEVFRNFRCRLPGTDTVAAVHHL